jgi:hypothetical protein
VQFQNPELRQIISGQTEDVKVYDFDGFLRGALTPKQALRFVTGEYYFGVGHRKRIRYIRPHRSVMSAGQLHAASRMTQRVRLTDGRLLPIPHVDHKPIQPGSR